MKKKRDDDILGNWCPLFGIVLPPGAYPSASQLGRCLTIIRDARAIWGIPDNPSHLFKGDPLILSRPAPEEVDYHRDWLIVARDISDNFIGIRSDTELPGLDIVQGKQIWHKRDDGMYEPCNSLDTNWEYAIERTKSRARGEAGLLIRDTTKFDFKILAILAIEEAWHAFRSITEYRESEDDPCILKSVQIAQSLLHKAEEKKTASEKKELEPDIKRGRKILQAAKDGGHAKGKSEIFPEMYDKWQEIANELWEKPAQRRWGRPSIAKKVCEYIKNQINLEPNNPKWSEILRKPETIRKKINKPA